MYMYITVTLAYMTSEILVSRNVFVFSAGGGLAPVITQFQSSSYKSGLGVFRVKPV